MNNLTATQIFDLIDIQTGSKRENIILDLVLSGRATLPHSFNYRTIKVENLEYYVLNDVFSLGTDEDFLRLPVFPETAQKIADYYGCILPTIKMVDDIWKQAEVKLTPRPISPKQNEASRESSIAYRKHNRIIDEQLKDKDRSLLIAGSKKDIVITSKLKENNKSVWIYGWHQDNGVPIQPLYGKHSSFYTDYSHGVRLINKKCLLDGKEVDIEFILKDKNLCKLLSNEGVVNIPKY